MKNAESTAKPRRALSTPAAMLAVALVIALVAALVPVTQAQAYYNFGTVKVSTGSSSVSVSVGSTVSTSVSTSPSSDDQTVGCGMAKCPQVCTDDDVIEAGYTCFDSNGQCTCAGRSYSTYYTETTASSSDSSVATASISGGTLTIKGVSAGTATITVDASLRQWTSGSTTVTVTVKESSSSSSSSSSGSTSSSSSSSGSGSSSKSSGSKSSASDSDDTIAILEEADTTDSVDDELNETVVETVAGTVYTVEINDYLVTSEEFAKLEEDEDQLIMWSGPSSDQPDYSWTYTGEDVDQESANLDYDPRIEISKLGTDDVANIMEQSEGGLVMDFAFEGALPGTATIYVATEGYFDDGETLSLYCFNEEERCFEEADQTDIEVEDGYAHFKLDHCSVWALSADDLSAYEVEETNTPGAASESVSADAGSDEGSEEDAGATVEETADEGGIDLATLLIIIAALIVVVAVVVVLVLRNRRANAPQEAAPEEAAAEPGASAEEASAEEAEAPAEEAEAPAEEAEAPADEDAEK